MHVKNEVFLCFSDQIDGNAANCSCIGHLHVVYQHVVTVEVSSVGLVQKLHLFIVPGDLGRWKTRGMARKVGCGPLVDHYHHNRVGIENPRYHWCVKKF